MVQYRHRPSGRARGPGDEAVHVLVGAPAQAQQAFTPDFQPVSLPALA
ncbi:hypothetical protein [Cupriavidus sp. CuC1]